MHCIALDGQSLTIDDVASVARSHDNPGEVTVALSEEAEGRVLRARRAVEEFLEQGRIVYGITTGFGAFKDRIIPPHETRQLQRNIIISHAVGVGETLDEATVRAMMLIRANTLAKGHSGVRPELLHTLISMINAGVYPVVPAQGSLGASGDLAPLAHMSLVIIGEGEARYRGELLPGAEAMRRAGIEPLTLEAKEGLALTNGTAMMCAVGSLATGHAELLCRVADAACCMSLEALHGTPLAFDGRIHAARPHPRQVECAAYLRRLIEGSGFTRPPDSKDVQDAYSLRCTPQVHGAVRDAVLYARWVLEIEINSATDNPLIFFSENPDKPGEEEATCISGGNFHGEIVAIAMDYLKIALTELGNISERRLTRLTDEASNRGTLPAFLIKKGGLNSGFMLTQYTAAALASENKSLSHPASIDTIPTSANTEDHVSMAPIAARQARTIASHVEKILAIELLAAAQGIDFRREIMGADTPLGRGTAPVYRAIRRRVPFLEKDDIMHTHIEAVRRMVADGELIRAVEEAVWTGQ